MSDAVIIALATGPAVLIVDRVITWLRNRRKDDAEVGLTVDQRWQAWADELRSEVDSLRERVNHLEADLTDERNKRRGLEAEIDRYKAEVGRYKQLARTFARHVLRLRDELAKVSGDVPVLPADVEDAMTIIELP